MRAAGGWGAFVWVDNGCIGAGETVKKFGEDKKGHAEGLWEVIECSLYKENDVS